MQKGILAHITVSAQVIAPTNPLMPTTHARCCHVFQLHDIDRARRIVYNRGTCRQVLQYEHYTE